MAWTQLILTFHNRDWLEPVSDFFVGAGALAAEIDGRTPQVTVLFHPETDLESVLARFRTFREAVNLPEPGYRRQTLADADWVATFREHFRPFQMNRFLKVVPSWEADASSASPTTLVVDPGQAFGTGLHPTTALAAEFVWETVTADPPDKVLDIGCGTGILSITALKAGAAHAIACDIDPLCSDAIHRHLQLNRIPRGQVTAFIGSADALRPGSFKLVVINIIESVIRQILPVVQESIADRLIISGVLAEAADTFTNYLSSQGFVVEQTRFREEWAAFYCRRQPCR